MASVATAVISGMTKASVTSLLNKFSQEVHHIQAFNEEVEVLTSQFAILQGFVQSAYYNNNNKMERYVLKWVQKVEDYVFEAEKILNECSWFSLHNDDSVSSSSIPSTVLRKVYKFPRNVCNKWRISRRINRLTKELRLMEKLAVHHGLTWQRVQPMLPVEACEVKIPSIIYQESFTVGLDAKVSELVSLMDNHTRIGVVGMGGIGKTRLLQHVFKEIKSRYEFSIWLCISQIYDVKSLQMDILHEILLDNPQLEALWKVTPERRAETIHETLKEKNCLIVLDDVWSSDPTQIVGSLPDNGLLEALGLPENVKMLVSTRHSPIVVDMRAYRYQMPHLSPGDSMKLFCLYAFGNADFHDQQEDFYDQQEDGILKIVKGCCNLPLALKTTARVLCLRYQGNPARFLLAEEQEEGIQSGKEIQDVVKRCLMRSYNVLPMELKGCFAYMAVLPEDYAIDQPKLVFLWMAEGFASSEHGGLNIIKQLCDRSLLEVVPPVWDDWGIPVQYKMHDRVRDLAVSIFNHVGGFSGGRTDELGKQMNSQKRISLGGLTGKSIPNDLSCGPQARTLLLFDNHFEDDTTPSIFKRAESLRVLGFSSTYFQSLDFLQRSKHLLFLDIHETYANHDVDKVSLEVAANIKGLKYLEYLLVPQLFFLPKWIGKFSRLTYLKMSMLRKGEPMLRNLRYLINLKELSYVSINWYFGFADLSKLQRLIVLHCETALKRPQMEEWMPPQSMQCLWFRNRGDDCDMPENWKVMTNIQCLRLERVSLTGGCQVFHKLVHLVLEYCSGNPPIEIAKLPGLTALRLYRFDHCAELPEEYGLSWAFPSLEHFFIYCFPLLKQLPRIERGAMRKLITLSVVDSHEFTFNNLPTEFNTRLAFETLREKPMGKRWTFNAAESYFYLDCGRHTLPSLLYTEEPWVRIRICHKNRR